MVTGGSDLVSISAHVLRVCLVYVLDNIFEDELKGVTSMAEYPMNNK